MHRKITSNVNYIHRIFFKEEFFLKSKFLYNFPVIQFFKVFHHLWNVLIRIVYHYCLLLLFQMIVARYMRVEPVTWAPNGPGLRLNYIGCFFTSVPTPRPTVPFSVPPVIGGPTIAPTTAIPTISPPTGTATSITLQPGTSFYNHIWTRYNISQIHHSV